MNNDIPPNYLPPPDPPRHHRLKVTQHYKFPQQEPHFLTFFSWFTIGYDFIDTFSKVWRSLNLSNPRSYPIGYLVDGKTDRYIDVYYAGLPRLADVMATVSFAIKREHIGQVVEDLFRQVKNMHDKNVVHGSINPENVYLARNAGEIRLVLGLVQSMVVLSKSKPQTNIPKDQTTTFGRHWAPPLCYYSDVNVLFHGLVSKKSDIYSLGMIVRVLYDGFRFPDVSAEEIVARKTAKQNLVDPLAGLHRISPMRAFLYNMVGDEAGCYENMDQVLDGWRSYTENPVNFEPK